MSELLWLTAAEAGNLSDDEKKSLPGIGPLTGALDVFADFFHVDPDLMRASAERPADAEGGAISDNAVREAIAAIPEAEKTALLQRLVDGDPHVAAEVRSRVREAVAPGARESRERRRNVAGPLPDRCGFARPRRGDRKDDPSFARTMAESPGPPLTPAPAASARRHRPAYGG